MLFAIATYLIYSNLMTISQAWVAQGKMSFALGVMLVHVLMLCLLPLLFYRRIAVLSFVRIWR
jgi:lipopolysaccharide export system permease protein